jgi:undecaprenyl-diphosphatase
MTDTRRAVAIPVVVMLIVGGSLVGLACLLGFWVFVRGEEPFAIDVWWNTFVAELWGPVLAAIAHAMDWIGGGWRSVLLIPIAGALALVLIRRPWAAAYFIAAEAVSALGVQVLKQTFGRVRPEDIIVVSDYGSYPSGHVANAATIAICAVVIFPRLWVALVGAGWVLLMAFSRTFLHAHWLSDTIGGAMIGAGTALLVAAAFAVPMTKERLARPKERASLG